MATAIGDIFPLAVGVALSPTSIVIVILILLSRDARPKGILFLIGWVAAMSIVAGLVILLSNEGNRLLNFGGGITLGPFILLAAGVLLIVFGVLEWRSRPEPGAKSDTPGWLRLADSVTAVRACGLGGYMSVGFPKNLMLVAGAAVAIAEAKLSTTSTTIVLAIFVVLASLGIAAPLGYSLVGGEPARNRLNTWKTWLIANNAAMVAVMLLVFGAVLLGKGIGQIGQ